nr:hypothetical protein CFP56_32847 [Quercus suber]
MPDLLSLLESHVGTTTLEVPIIPRSLTLIPLIPPQTKPVDKKQKRDKKDGKGSTEEGEIQEETPPEQTKVMKTSQTQQRRGGEDSEMILKHRSRVSSWNPPLILDRAPPSIDSSIRNFDHGRASYMANSVEQALLLSRHMAELRNLKKHEMFLSPKRDLALALNAAGVDPSSELRNLEDMFYPPAIKVHTSAQSPPSTPATTQPSPVENPPPTSSTTTPSTSTVATDTFFGKGSNLG